MSEVLLVAQDQVRRYGGTYGVHDPALLSSALAMPSAAFGGTYLHADLYQQAAAYALHICQNNPFLDGSKRTALASALAFLALNGIELQDPDSVLYNVMIDVARGKKGKAEIAAAFKSLRAGKKRRKPLA
jgi:death-on-curing protein